jgi:hypothetical protein
MTITKQHQQGVVLRIYCEIYVPPVGVSTQGVNKIDFLQILVKININDDIRDSKRIFL